MSGDVQPRKRKDKKKRKDEDGYSPLNEDVNIHVHKEGGTGGNICAKIVFFFLFSALIVLIGLIIKENQGITELDDVDSESRYSQIFEGWVDKNHDDHEEDHSPELSNEHDDHDLEEEEDDHYESEEDNVEETEEDQSEEADNDIEEEDDEDSTTRSEEETNEETEEDDQIPESEEDNTVEEDNSEEADEQSVSEEKEKDETEEDDDDINEADKDVDEGNEDSKEAEKSREQSKEDNKNSDEDRAVDKSEEVEKEPTLKKDVSKEIARDIKVEPKEAQDEKEPVEETLTEKKQAEKVQGEPVKQSSGMATKIGVGVALLAVAYNVFFRKRSPEKPLSRTVSEEETTTPDLSRRNTLVSPPSLQEVEPDLPEYEGEGEEYSEEEYSDEDSRSEHRSAREEYQELRSNYTRLTGEHPDEINKAFEEEVLEHDDRDDDDIEEEELEEEEVLEDEEIEDDYDRYDEDEDEELLKRLEAKYGKLGRDVNVGEEFESDSDKEDYEHSNITNPEDYKIKEDIDAAQEHLKKNAAYANKLFDVLLDKYPVSPRTLYGKAKALDIFAEEKQSNELLQQSLSYYMRALNAPNVPDPLFVIIAERYIDRARFIGQYKKAVAAHWQLIERFPDNPKYLNNLAVTYLTINLIEEARSVLKRVLSKWPNDGFALVHYGFILKTADNDLEESIHYMVKGLKTKEPGVIDGRFYFHLGDALTRLNRNEEAMQLYEEGVQEKVFMSKYQRSLYNVPRLAAKPWWEPGDLLSYQRLFLALKDNWQKIRTEGLSALNDQGYFQDEAENLKDTGTWKQLELFARGQKFTKNCAKSPVTCSIIQSFPDARSCRRGQTKFSVMHPGTHVWPHCGPTNCRLRVHLGLKIPPNTFIRVAEETRSWKEGDIIIFDDSFEHEVWHNGSDFRLVLIVDVWHPELTPSEKKSLSSI